MANDLPIAWEHFEGVLFDLDGVITPTAELHRQAWGTVFAEYGFSDADYLAYVDGKPRYDGVASFLDSQGIAIARGEPDDPPGNDTVCAIGNQKDQVFNTLLDSGVLSPYPGSLRVLDHLGERSVRIGLVTSSRNATRVLAVTGLADRFEIVVDGVLAEQAGLAGKPAPDTYLVAAELLGVAALRSVVVEDATSGVRAGRQGGFGLVLGVDRGGNRSALIAAGAHLVVDDLDETID